MSARDDRHDARASANTDLRGQRILDYRDQALAEENPLLANLGAGNSDLMHYQYLLRKHLDEALTQAAPSSDDVELVLLPAISQILKVNKQIERNTQFGHRVKQAEQAEQSAAAQLAAAVAALPDQTQENNPA